MVFKQLEIASIFIFQHWYECAELQVGCGGYKYCSTDGKEVQRLGQRYIDNVE